MLAPAIIVHGDDPPVLDGWTRIGLEHLPDEPFSLAHERLAVYASVADEATAHEVLVAAARGAAVVVSLQLQSSAAEQFVDELGRIAEVIPPPPPEVPLDLDDDHVALLDALADGLTVAAAARRVGVSRRTAVRRLAEARVRLGASSTTEAVRAYVSARSRDR